MGNQTLDYLQAICCIWQGYDELDLIFYFFVRNLWPMTKTFTVEVERVIAERQLFGARRRLEHLVKMYYNRRWRRYYTEDAFAKVVREARQAVDHWTEVVSRSMADRRTGDIRHEFRLGPTRGWEKFQAGRAWARWSKGNDRI